MLKRSLSPSPGAAGVAVAMVFLLTHVIVGTGAGQTAAPSMEVKEAARQVMENAQGSVVTIVAPVRGVPGEPGKTIETLGTVVTAEGLTVSSNAVLDAKRVSGGASTEFAYLEMVLPNGATVPAEIVYRDAGLDLVFLKPDARISQQRGAVYQPVSLGGGRALEVMDEVLVISRLDQSAGRTASISLGNVSAVVQGDQPGYQTSTSVPGAPVYGLDGGLIGVTVYRMVQGTASSPVTVSAQAIGTVVEIAEATEYLASSTGLGDEDLMRGLTLTVPTGSLPSSPPPPSPPIPAAVVAAPPPMPTYSPAPVSAPSSPPPVPAPPPMPVASSSDGGALGSEAAPVPEEKKGWFGFLNFKGKEKKGAADAVGEGGESVVAVEEAAGAEVTVVAAEPTTEKKPGGFFGFFKGGKKKGAGEVEMMEEEVLVEPISEMPVEMPGGLTAVERASLQEAGIEGLPPAGPVTATAPMATMPDSSAAPAGLDLAVPPSPQGPGPEGTAAEEAKDGGKEDGVVPLRMMKRVPKGKPKIDVLF